MTKPVFLRWAVRLLCLVYYPVLGALLYDLFTFGLRWRSVVLFAFSLLAVSGTHIGWRADRSSVAAWFWISSAWLGLLTFGLLASPAVAVVLDVAAWEKPIPSILLFISAIFFAVHAVTSALSTRATD